MPEITRFYGIIIKMFLPSSKNYDYSPNFFALYDENIGNFDISTLDIIYGDLPPRAVSIVKEWAALHQSELLEMWNTQNIHKLQPLR